MTLPERLELLLTITRRMLTGREMADLLGVNIEELYNAMEGFDFTWCPEQKRYIKNGP